jgi:hypothetical protein
MIDLKSKNLDIHLIGCSAFISVGIVFQLKHSWCSKFLCYDYDSNLDSSHHSNSYSELQVSKPNLLLADSWLNQIDLLHIFVHW